MGRRVAFPLQSTETCIAESVDSPGLHARSSFRLTVPDDPLSCSSRVDVEDKNWDSICIPFRSARVGLCCCACCSLCI